MLVTGLSALAATLGLVGVFFVLFPLLVNGLVAFIVAQVMAEKRDNDAYAGTHRVPGAPVTPVE